MKTTRVMLKVAMMVAAIGLATGAQAATISTSQTAPTVDGADIASGPGTTAAWSKYWIWDGDVPGQTFTIGARNRPYFGRVDEARLLVAVHGDVVRLMDLAREAGATNLTVSARADVG